MSNIIIIGAGPVGCYAAYLLAKKGHKVSIYEEHEEIGLPFQCTGVLTRSFEGIIDIPDNIIDNRIKKIKVNAPDGNFIELRLKKHETILNRTEFDRYLGKKAISEGARIFTKHRFMGIKQDKIGKAVIKDFKKKR